MAELAVLKYVSPTGKKVYGDPDTQVNAPAGSKIQVPHSTETLRAGGFTNITTDSSGKVTGYTRPVPESNQMVTVSQVQVPATREVFTPESIAPTSRFTSSTPLTRYQRAERYLSGKLTSAGEYFASRGITKEKAVNKLVGAPDVGSYQMQDKTMRSYFDFQKQFTSRIISNVQEKPLTFGLTTGAYAAATYVLPIAGASVIKYIPPIVETGIAAGVTGWYAGGVIERVALTPKGQRATALADITTGELAPMIVGGYIGSTTIPRGISYLKTIGRTELAASSLIPSSVLSGTKTFPTAPKRVQEQLFLKTTAQKIPGQIKPIGFHATSSKFWGTTIETTAGTSELPGMYISSYISPHFLKINNKKYSIGSMKLFGSTSNPAVVAIEPKGFRVVQYAKTATGYKFLTPERAGYADIPLMKTEIEAILRPGTIAKKISSKFYFKYAGTRVPLDIFKVTGTTGTKNMFTSGRVSSSYQMPTSLTSPSSYGIASLLGGSKYSAPSKPTYPSPSYPSQPSRRTALSYISSPIKSSTPSRGSSGRSSTPSITSMSRGSSGLSRSFSSSISPVKSSSRALSSSTVFSPFNRKTNMFGKGLKFKAPTGKRSPFKFAQFKPRYTPSVGGYIFNIKGKKPKGLELATGLKMRPLTI